MLLALCNVTHVIKIGKCTMEKSDNSDMQIKGDAHKKNLSSLEKKRFLILLNVSNQIDYFYQIIFSYSHVQISLYLFLTK